MGMLENKILAGVRVGISKVPAPVRNVMGSKTALLTCGVLGGALTAYSQDGDGGQAIAGALIGVGLVTAQKVPFKKLIAMVPMDKLIGLVLRRK